MAKKKRKHKKRKDWDKIDKGWQRVVAGVQLQQAIAFYLRTDPEFKYELEELDYQLELGEITSEERNEALRLALEDARYRRANFMTSTLKEKKTPKSAKRKSTQAILKEYRKFVQERELKIENLRERLREKRQKELKDNPDYQNMVKAFARIEKKSKR